MSARSGKKFVFRGLTRRVCCDFVVGRDVRCYMSEMISRQDMSFLSRLLYLIGFNKQNLHC